VSQAADGKCLAEEAGEPDCPENATCNPPPPTPVECPAGIGPDEQRRMWQQDQASPCMVDPPALCERDCVARSTACPSWD
jgi:hypothetical protein